MATLPPNTDKNPKTKGKVKIANTNITDGFSGSEGPTAIVNAANEWLDVSSGQQGITKVIYNATIEGEGGPTALKKLQDDCTAALGDKKALDPGEARSTPAYGSLATKGISNIIHAVGPRWTGDPADAITQIDQLISSYKEALKRAAESKPPIKSIRFPTISGGIFTGGNPPDAIVAAAVVAVREYYSENPSADINVEFVCLPTETRRFKLYEDFFAKPDLDRTAVHAMAKRENEARAGVGPGSAAKAAAERKTEPAPGAARPAKPAASAPGDASLAGRLSAATDGSAAAKRDASALRGREGTMTPVATASRGERLAALATKGSTVEPKPAVHVQITRKDFDNIAKVKDELKDKIEVKTQEVKAEGPGKEATQKVEIQMKAPAAGAAPTAPGTAAPAPVAPIRVAELSFEPEKGNANNGSLVARLTNDKPTPAHVDIMFKQMAEVKGPAEIFGCDVKGTEEVAAQMYVRALLNGNAPAFDEDSRKHLSGLTPPFDTFVSKAINNLPDIVPTKELTNFNAQFPNWKAALAETLKPETTEPADKPVRPR